MASKTDRESLKKRKKVDEGEYRDEDTAKLKVRQRQSGWRFDLLSFHALPSFLKDNEYLLHNHRPQLESFLDCVKSLFRLHTETWNIWTHIAGCLLFVLITLYSISWPNPHVEASWQQQITFFIFYGGAIFCMGVSAMYHTFICHSAPVSRRLAKMDYCGVITMIVTSFMPWVHYGFYCQRILRAIYLTSTLILGVICIIVVLQDKFAEPRFRPLRAGLFIALGLTGVVPALHYIYQEGLVPSLDHLSWLSLMAIMYIAGGLIYAVRIPERLSPGTFDVWCQSHQILHMCVIFGALISYFGVSRLASHRVTGVLDSCSYPDHMVM